MLEKLIWVAFAVAGATVLSGCALFQDPEFYAALADRINAVATTATVAAEKLKEIDADQSGNVSTEEGLIGLAGLAGILKSHSAIRDRKLRATGALPAKASGG